MAGSRRAGASLRRLGRQPRRAPARPGYARGSLAGVIEADLGQPPVLTGISASPEFVCGTQFSTIAEETLFRSTRLSIGAVAVEVFLEPAELLLFDNLTHSPSLKDAGAAALGELH